MANDVRNFQQQLRQSGATQADLRSADDVLRALQELGTERGGTAADWQGMQQLSSAALDKIQKLEFELRKRTDTSSNELFLSGSDDAPAKYRDLVGDYFRALSKKSSGAGAKAQSR